jgi:hypothetical protein
LHYSPVAEDATGAWEVRPQKSFKREYMKATIRWSIAGLALMGWLQVPSARGVAVGQTDDFEDGTTQGWVVALLGLGVHPAPPENVSSGGPGGVDDNFLKLTSVGGAGAGSRLSVINLAQWGGDYLGSGVGGITMDVRNFGTTDLSLRLLLADPGVATPPGNIAISSNPILLPAGGEWTSVAFPIAIAGMTAVLGDVGTALQNATELRIFHGVVATAPGEALDSILGVDNIRAVSSVPDSSNVMLLSAIGLAALALGRRTRE